MLGEQKSPAHYVQTLAAKAENDERYSGFLRVREAFGELRSRERAIARYSPFAHKADLNRARGNDFSEGAWRSTAVQILGHQHKHAWFEAFGFVPWDGDCRHIPSQHSEGAGTCFGSEITARDLVSAEVDIAPRMRCCNVGLVAGVVGVHQAVGVTLDRCNLGRSLRGFLAAVSKGNNR